MANVCYFVIDSNDVKFPTILLNNSMCPVSKVNLRIKNLDFIPRIGEKVQLNCKTLFNDMENISLFKIFPKLEKEKPIQYRERLYKFLLKRIDKDRRWLNLYSRIPYRDLLGYFMEEVIFELVVTDVKTTICNTDWGKDTDKILQTVFIYLKDTSFESNGE